MTISIETANEQLRILQKDQSEGRIDHSTFRRRRTEILDHLVGAHEDTVTALHDLRGTLLDPTSDDTTGRALRPEVTQANPLQQPKPQGLLRRLPPVVFFIAGLLLVSAIAFFWPTTPDDPAEQHPRTDNAAAALPEFRDPQLELVDFADSESWDVAQIQHFALFWQSIDVEQRFELRLMPEYDLIRRRAQAMLAANRASSQGDPRVSSNLRSLLRELE